MEFRGRCLTVTLTYSKSLIVFIPKGTWVIYIAGEKPPGCVAPEIAAVTA